MRALKFVVVLLTAALFLQGIAVAKENESRFTFAMMVKL